ncbi:unnamed protein product [Bursaphelenchus xylophilus]|uniref:(pine wood nematode) hypothetical protein n=1 Tax=Bursaphelenchus xylophilus TaxID=6326 RepID=A0A7I8WP59_BURXY|nr:unnamed protein product [Bursaphelenchus xylophilus]CAG9094728.1 unnamed protein product [Bursaphelenchus xylophilus]
MKSSINLCVLLSMLSMVLVVHSEPIPFAQQSLKAPSTTDGLQPPKIEYAYDKFKRGVDLTQTDNFCKGFKFGYIPDILNYLQLYELLQTSKNHLTNGRIAIGLKVTVPATASPQKPPTIEWVGTADFKHVVSYAPFDGDALPTAVPTDKTYFYEMDAGDGKWYAKDIAQHGTAYTGTILCSKLLTSKSDEL